MRKLAEWFYRDCGLDTSDPTVAYVMASHYSLYSTAQRGTES